jgi:DNA-binding XRE family transcriptional regulator
MLFEIKGDIPSQVLGYLQQQFGSSVEIVEEEEEFINLFETNWYKQISATITPGDAMKVYRENYGLSLAELGQKLGNLTEENIAEMECSKCEINPEVAKKLGQLFEVSIERFL